MHIRDNIINYIQDNEYSICFYDNNVYIYKYNQLQSFSENNITFQINNRTLVRIKGINMSIQKITKEEVLISGSIYSIEKKEHNE